MLAKKKMQMADLLRDDYQPPAPRHPAAFPAASSGNLELPAILCLPNSSPLSISTPVPGVVPASGADDLIFIPSLSLDIPWASAFFKWYLIWYSMKVRSTRSKRFSIQEGRSMRSQGRMQRLFSVFLKENEEIGLENGTGERRRGVRTKWFICTYTWENERQSFKLIIGLGFLLIINYNSKL